MLSHRRLLASNDGPRAFVSNLLGYTMRFHRPKDQTSRCLRTTFSVSFFFFSFLPFFRSPPFLFSFFFFIFLSFSSNESEKLCPEKIHLLNLTLFYGESLPTGFVDICCSSSRGSPEKSTAVRWFTIIFVAGPEVLLFRKFLVNRRKQPRESALELIILLAFSVGSD